MAAKVVFFGQTPHIKAQGGRYNLAAMKVYLRNIQTGAYYQKARLWTFHRENAWNFQTVLDALDWSQNLPDFDLEIVLGFDDGQKDIRLSAGWMASKEPQTARLAA